MSLWPCSEHAFSYMGALKEGCTLTDESSQSLIIDAEHGLHKCWSIFVPPIGHQSIKQSITHFQHGAGCVSPPTGHADVILQTKTEACG